jgi:hypothetical protein
VVWYKSFLYQAASWKTARRVVAKVEFHFGELFPRVGFIVTNLETDSRAVVRFYNKRRTAEQWIKEGKHLQPSALRVLGYIMHCRAQIDAGSVQYLVPIGRDAGKEADDQGSGKKDILCPAFEETIDDRGRTVLGDVGSLSLLH